MLSPLFAPRARNAVRAAAKLALASLEPRMLQPHADAMLQRLNAHAADERADAERALRAHDALLTLLATAPPHTTKSKAADGTKPQ